AVAPESQGDVYVRDGDIAAIGPALDVPAGVLVLDGSNRHLAPGVIDNHSHMAVEGSVNEGTLSITCDVDISDVIDPKDLTIYRALAGGVTSARILHGSANAIGGRHEVIKLKWGRRAEELKFPGAKEGVKFALGHGSAVFPRVFTREGIRGRVEGLRGRESGRQGSDASAARRAARRAAR